MKRKILYYLLLLLLMAISVIAEEPHNIEMESYRIIPIPLKTDYGFRNFYPAVITSEIDLKEYLKIKGKSSASKHPSLEQIFTDAKVDYDREALIILVVGRHSGSVTYMHETPVLINKTLLCELSRDHPMAETEDVQYTCFALAVDKRKIEIIEFIPEGGEKAMLTIPNPDE